MGLSGRLCLASDEFLSARFVIVDQVFFEFLKLQVCLLLHAAMVHSQPPKLYISWIMNGSYSSSSFHAFNLIALFQEEVLPVSPQSPPRPGHWCW